jgi:hypothetical protein
VLGWPVVRLFRPFLAFLGQMPPRNRIPIPIPISIQIPIPIRFSTPTPSPRAAGRIPAALAVALGVLAVSALAGFLAVLATRKSEVDLLIEILAGNNRADAAWAFEKLKEVSDDQLHELAARVDDQTPTVLHLLHWEGQGTGSHTGYRDEPFCVGDVVRFLLGGRLRLPHHWRSAGSTELPTNQDWAKEIARFERTRVAADGYPLEAYPAPRRFPLVPTVVPPSRLPELASLAAVRDAASLLEVLGSGGKAEAAWALEVLRDLPDEDLDPLIHQADSEAPTRIYHLGSKSGGTSSSEAFRTGEVVQFLLRDRLGLAMEIAEPRPGLVWDLARRIDLLELIVAWQERRAKAPGK